LPFFFQAEDGIRDFHVTGVQTCALPIFQLDQRRTARVGALLDGRVDAVRADVGDAVRQGDVLAELHSHLTHDAVADLRKALSTEIGRAPCRERGVSWGGASWWTWHGSSG